MVRRLFGGNGTTGNSGWIPRAVFVTGLLTGLAIRPFEE